MRFVALVVTQGAMPAEALAEMNRDWPAYAEEMERRGGFRLGRELNLPDAGVATVCVRGGETLVTDGPFVETKEFIAGIEVFEAVDQDEAIAVESRNPVARFNPLEIRPVPDAFRLGSNVAAFADGDDSEGIPYLLMIWADAEPAARGDEAALTRDCEGWRTHQEETGAFVLGGAIGAPATARTLSSRNAEIEAGEGPFLETTEFITGLEIVRAANLDGAVELAASHPLARRHAIEVRSFYSQAA